MKFLNCFSGKVISEFSLLNPQNNKKPLITYTSVGDSALKISNNSQLIGA